MLILVAAGCGDEDEPEAPAAEGSTALSLVLEADGPKGEPPRGASVACEAGDDSPCGALEPADLEPVGADVACTEIYGGPDEVTVDGTIADEPVSATLTRANGCEIERFDRLTPLLQELFSGYEPGESIAP